jgi:hypothetical protein
MDEDVLTARILLNKAERSGAFPERKGYPKKAKRKPTSMKLAG